MGPHWSLRQQAKKVVLHISSSTDTFLFKMLNLCFLWGMSDTSGPWESERRDSPQLWITLELRLRFAGRAIFWGHKGAKAYSLLEHMIAVSDFQVPPASGGVSSKTFSTVLLSVCSIFHIHSMIIFMEQIVLDIVEPWSSWVDGWSLKAIWFLWFSAVLFLVFHVWYLLCKHEQ